MPAEPQPARTVVHPDRRCGRGARVALAAVIGVGAAFVAQGRAEACSPEPGSMEVQLPVGPEMPANGILLLESTCGISEEAVQATVDGVGSGIELVAVGPVPAFRLFPTPPAGAEIGVTFAPPDDTTDLWLLDCTYPAPIRVVATAPDETPPAAPAVSVSLSPGERNTHPCNEPSRTIETLRWDISIQSDPEETRRGLVHLIEIRGPDGAPLRSTFPLPPPADGTPFELTLGVDRSQLSSGTHCVAVRTIDAAGNEADVAESCEDVEPEAIFDGGCSVAGPHRGAPPLFLFALLALGGGRRWIRRLRRPLRRTESRRARRGRAASFRSRVDAVSGQDYPPGWT